MPEAGLPEVLERIEALEAYVGRNDARITAIETRQHAAIAGAQREFEAARETRQRDRWLATLRRR